MAAQPQHRHDCGGNGGRGCSAAVQACRKVVVMAAGSAQPQYRHHGGAGGQLGCSSGIMVVAIAAVSAQPQYSNYDEPW